VNLSLGYNVLARKSADQAEKIFEKYSIPQLVLMIVALQKH
jgi:hypothetical protein